MHSASSNTTLLHQTCTPPNTCTPSVLTAFCDAPAGLSVCAQDVSARRVAAAVVLQVQQLEWAMQQAVDIDDEWAMIRESLDDAGINADGVIGQITSRVNYVSGLFMALYEIAFQRCWVTHLYLSVYSRSK